HEVSRFSCLLYCPRQVAASQWNIQGDNNIRFEKCAIIKPSRRRSFAPPFAEAPRNGCSATAKPPANRAPARGRRGAPRWQRRTDRVLTWAPERSAVPGQVKVFRALYTFEPRTPDELYFEEGDIIYISDMSDTNWWKGTSKGRTGLIPSNYVAEQAESIDNPLHEAAKRGNLSWLRECLDNRVGVNGLDKAGSTALYWACHGGHKDVVEVLFTQPNIELNQQNKLGDTALHAASWKGYADIVEMLLAKGARTDLRNNEKKLALDMATNAACAALLKKKQGTDVVRTLSNAEDYLDDEDSD
ncbi:osteoclast-stimulating factor 1, partial [Petaurus breviceps papuanus]|uniref:osteoclast-stimulating factor 1 n=1 Tax=Petaurus breviceps papuanus TaxID=3040969 RepID=UPI0036D7F5DF